MTRRVRYSEGWMTSKVLWKGIMWGEAGQSGRAVPKRDIEARE